MTEPITLRVVDQEGLSPFQKGLASLEQSILYPIDDGADQFCIDHGALYHQFFTHMGKSRFLIVQSGDTVIGSMAGVWRTAQFGDVERTGLYFCDLKLTKDWRGKRLVQRMLWHILLRWPVTPDFWGWRFVYLAAMRGAERDVSHSFRGWHLGKLVQPVSLQSLYFVDAGTLASLPSGGPPPPKGRGLDFSPRAHHSPLVEDTYGRKEFRLQSTGRPWRLAHLPKGPSHWPEDYGAYLRECGMSLQASDPESLACFGLDQRLTPQIDWLAAQGIERGAQCFVYGFSIPGFAPMMGQFDWVHLACSEI